MAKGGDFHEFWQAAKSGFAAALLCVLTLSSAEAGSGSRNAAKQTRDYNIAIQQQTNQITNARAQLRKAGCGLAIFGRSAAICSELNAALARMEKNLTHLQNKRAQLARRSDSQQKPSVTRKAKVQEKPQISSQATQPRNVTGKPRPRNVSGKLRTLCVRTCDGYYFPVSWSVSQAAFDRDSRACEAICPGTNVELYYHRIAGEEPANMVSASTGLPYSESETAFLYKKPGISTPADCSCGAPAQNMNGFQTIGGNYQANYPGNDGGWFAPDTAQTATIPQPRQRPDPADDPETLSTREGGLDAAALKALATPLPATGTSPTQRPIRVVGPVFLPGPEAAEDQPVPAPAHAR